jgi:hypothetical protein
VSPRRVGKSVMSKFRCSYVRFAPTPPLLFTPRRR